VSAGDATSLAPGGFARWRAEHESAIRQLRLYAHLFRGSFSSMLGLGLVAAFLLLAAFGPYVVPYPADVSGALDLSHRLEPPSWQHWFGTDEMGADIFTRIVVATRTSLEIGLMITGVATVIGVPLGIVAAYRGGAIREAVMRATDIFLSVPSLVLALAIVAALGAGITNGIIAL
jgi:peptide/nickel transport system permease protein